MIENKSINRNERLEICYLELKNKINLYIDTNLNYFSGNKEKINLLNSIILILKRYLKIFKINTLKSFLEKQKLYKYFEEKSNLLFSK